MDGHSPEEYGDAGEEQEVWDHETKQEHSSGTTSPTGPESATGSQNKAAIPLQKRRRVTRACDECRRKKIKCDGKQPCTHCTVYSYDCTYDQPSNRRRNPAPQYIEGLEGRVHRAEALLHMIIPNLDLNDPAIDIAVAQGFIPGLKNKMPEFVESKKQQHSNGEFIEPKKDTNLESMVRAVGQIELDESGRWDYHGHSSGLSFVRRMREQLGDIMGPETVATPFIKSRPASHIIDSPKSTNYAESPLGSPSESLDLPPEDIARTLCNNSISETAVLLRTVHLPTFWRSFKRIYSMAPEQFADEDHRFLPLLYSVLAVGSVYGNNQDQEYESGIDQGFKYFRAARQMMDIADCRDLTSLQAIVFMILFLQSSAKLSQCYTYVGVALRSALRMGLHRNITQGFNPLECELRKRTFWTIRKMDIYVGAMLGLPQTLSDEDVDQEYPAEVDDEYITEQAILPMPEGSVSLLTAFNVHTRLNTLLTKIVRNVYPIKPRTGASESDKTYTVPFSVIRDIENDLENWKDSLPEGLSPSHHNPKLTRAQNMLRLAYAFAQVLLYRPFLHFVATEKRSRQIDTRAYTCAASYVNVARNIIHLCTQMKQKGLLNGAFWFIMYTTFFSILSLVYFAAENPDNPTTEALMKDALEGRRVLASIAKRSMAADRCTATLDSVFNRLPEWMREGKPNPSISRKRGADGDLQQQQEQQSQPQPHQAGSHPDIAATARDQVPQLQQRASTFPNQKNKANLARVDTRAFDPKMPSAAQSMSNVAGNVPFTPPSASYAQQTFDTSPLNPTMNYGMPPNPNLPDLSAMMFPSAEPFTYPNQPLTTFENNQFTKQPQYYNNINNFDDPAAIMGSRMVQPDSDNMEAQLFALPPYMMQNGQWPVNLQTQNRHQRAPPHNPMPGSSQQSMQAGPIPSNGNWNNQQAQTFADINLNDIFGGGEWNNSLMDQNY